VSLSCNVTIICIVIFLWRDIAPRKNFVWQELNPLAGLPMFKRSGSMATYGILILQASFALNIYTSTLAYYCENFLGMSKALFSALGVEWALVSALCMGAVQPALSNLYGEVRTLQMTFVALLTFFVLFSLLTESTWWASYLVMPFFSFSTMAYPLAVGLATREVEPEEQGKLQGAVSVLETTGKILAPLLASEILIPLFDGPGQFHGAVYLVAGLIVAPGVWLSCQQTERVTYLERTDDKEVSLTSIA